MKDNQLKTEQQMDDLHVAKKSESKILLILGIKFIFVYVVLLMFDVLLDGVMSFFDLMIEFIHILIEIVELLAEEGLEAFFHTEHQQSEMIILNSALIVSLIGLYYFIRALPHLIRAIEKLLLMKLRAYCASSWMHWKSYSIIMKMKLILMYILGFLGLIMLVG